MSETKNDGSIYGSTSPNWKWFSRIKSNNSLVLGAIFVKANWMRCLIVYTGRYSFMIGPHL
jgi:hypothetical protein